jgi:hypothetical protein
MQRREAPGVGLRQLERAGCILAAQRGETADRIGRSA